MKVGEGRAEGTGVRQAPVMDAGVAAVLGATVGAVGTGGTGIVAALLARSQARSQIRAEHLRLMREPRKNAYVAYIEASRKHYFTLSKADTNLKVMHSIQEDEDQDELKEEAFNLFKEATDQLPTIEHLEAEVYIEGPRVMITAAVDLCDKLTTYRSSVWNAIKSDNPETEDSLAALAEARSDAYEAYLDFLYKASEAVDIDTLHSKPD